MVVVGATVVGAIVSGGTVDVGTNAIVTGTDAAVALPDWLLQLVPATSNPSNTADVAARRTGNAKKGERISIQASRRGRRNYGQAQKKKTILPKNAGARWSFSDDMYVRPRRPYARCETGYLSMNTCNDPV